MNFVNEQAVGQRQLPRLPQNPGRVQHPRKQDRDACDAKGWPTRHIEDDMNFLKSYDPATGQYFGGLNFTHFDTEFQAFEAGSGVKSYTMFPRGPGGYQKLTNYIYRAYPNADQLVFPPSHYPQGNPPQ